MRERVFQIIMRVLCALSFFWILGTFGAVDTGSTMTIGMLLLRTGCGTVVCVATAYLGGLLK